MSARRSKARKSGSHTTLCWRKESGANPSLEQVHASGDRLGQAGGRGYKRNGGSTPCVSYHHRRKYVRAAQDRWAPQPRKSARHAGKTAKIAHSGGITAIQRRRLAMVSSRLDAPCLCWAVLWFCPAVSLRLVTGHMQFVGKSSPPFPMLILTALKRLLDQRVCPNTGRSGMGRRFSYHLPIHCDRLGASR